MTQKLKNLIEEDNAATRLLYPHAQAFSFDFRGEVVRVYHISREQAQRLLNRDVLEITQ